MLPNSNQAGDSLKGTKNSRDHQGRIFFVKKTKKKSGRTTTLLTVIILYSL